MYRRTAVHSTRRYLLPVMLGAWGLITFSAIGLLWAYDAKPGTQHPAPSTTQPIHNRYSLLLFLHPECPCSRATVSELARLTARTAQPVDVCVYFVLPEGADDGSWSRTAIHDAAALIPGVTIATDPAGRLARQYGAATSGQAVLYSPDGKLAFSGGITPSRAHEGDNLGESAIISILAGQTPATTKSPVFGCALFDNDVPTAERKAKN